MPPPYRPKHARSTASALLPLPCPPLPPCRRKDLKNPRKKHRVKFAAATKRRKGQVQGVREAPGAGYGGEATGVKSHVTKSRKFGR